MMLQVISKKFFKSDNYHRTKEKYIIYSNVNLFHKVETEIATLERIETFRGITTYVLRFENVLEYQKDPRFQLVSVGQNQIVEDLIACFSFFFNGIFSVEKEFVEKLLRSSPQNVCDTTLPQKLLPQIFMRDININEDRSYLLNDFFKNLVGLPNQKYIKVITSIKQLHEAIISVSNNVNLAYIMIVASIESLATKLDDYTTTWQDCLTKSKRRERLDDILSEVEDGIAEEIRKIIIEDTHPQLSLRYKNFILKYINESYYEEKITEGIIRCKESQLNTAINNSYNIRSSYIHALDEIPSFIKIAGNREVFNNDNKSFFSFIGLIRITKFVINRYIELEEKLEKEDLNYFKYLPGSIEVKMASEYWIGNEEGYTNDTGKQYYQGLIEFISKGEYKEKGFIDLRAVCSKIERLIKGENNKEKKGYMLYFYLLYNYMVSEIYRCNNLEKIETKYGYLIEEKRIENVILYIILGAKLPWNLKVIQEIYNEYDKSRNNSNTLSVPSKLELCLILEMANFAYEENEEELLDKYINKAFKESSDDEFIKDIYYKFKKEKKFEKVSWYEQYIVGK